MFGGGGRSRADFRNINEPCGCYPLPLYQREFAARNKFLESKVSSYLRARQEEKAHTMKSGARTDLNASDNDNYADPLTLCIAVFALAYNYSNSILLTPTPGLFSTGVVISRLLRLSNYTLFRHYQFSRPNLLSDQRALLIVTT